MKSYYYAKSYYAKLAHISRSRGGGGGGGGEGDSDTHLKHVVCVVTGSVRQYHCQSGALKQQGPHWPQLQ